MSTMDVALLAKTLNEACEDPRQGFYAYGLARESLPVWESEQAEDMLTDLAAHLVEYARRAKRAGY